MIDDKNTEGLVRKLQQASKKIDGIYGNNKKEIFEEVEKKNRENWNKYRSKKTGGD